MYAKEMRGDSKSQEKNLKRDEKNNNNGSSVLNKGQEQPEDFLFPNYGNYGDPYSFAPYQLILLCMDFVLNWTMDLTHNDPLAVLVIFVFQSLAIIINVLLYIMASASQGMQVGVKKHVILHHWMNVVTCLLYLSTTIWWFIWALRKSWPSVSDQFSFTWPNTDLESLNSSKLTGNGSSSVNNTVHITELQNMSRLQYSPNDHTSHHLNEHYTLWSPGFSSLYVIHRTLAILYYFVYLRSTFLVLNTPAIDKFVESKAKLSEFLRSEQNSKSNSGLNQSNWDGHRKKDLDPSSHINWENDWSTSGYSLGIDKPRERKPLETSLSKQKRKPKRQILWADEDKDEPNDKYNVAEVHRSPTKERRNSSASYEQNEPIKSPSTKRPKKKHRTKSVDVYQTSSDVDPNEGNGGGGGDAEGGEQERSKNLKKKRLLESRTVDIESSHNRRA